MNTNIAIQYTIVCIIVIAALIWFLVKANKTRKNKSSGCSGCPLTSNCNKQELKDRIGKDPNSSGNPCR